jgi:hypothetical protein
MTEDVLGTDNIALWPTEIKARAFAALLDAMPTTPELFKVLSEKLNTPVHEHPLVRCDGRQVRVWLPPREPNVRYANRPGVTGGNAVARDATPEATAERIKKRFGLLELPLEMTAFAIAGFHNHREADEDGTGGGTETALVFPLYLPKNFEGDIPHPQYWASEYDISFLDAGPHPLMRHHRKMLPAIFDWARMFYDVDVE